jgi:hypothetical protein
MAHKKDKIVRYRALKARKGCGGIVPLIFNIGTNGAQWLASLPGRFTPVERTPSTHLIGDRGFQTRSGRFGGYKIPLPGIEPRSCSRNAGHYTSHAVPNS